MPPPARSCHLGANQEGGMFYGRMAQVERLSTAAVLNSVCNGGKSRGQSWQRAEMKVPSLLTSLFFSASGLKLGTAGQ